MTSDHLKALRDSMQLTQTEMAAWFGESVVQLRTYQYWESGERKVPAYVVEIIRLNKALVEMPYDGSPTVD